MPMRKSRRCWLRSRPDDGSMQPYQGTYSAEKAEALKGHSFDRVALGQKGQPYEKLDQLLIELLLGIR